MTPMFESIMASISEHQFTPQQVTWLRQEFSPLGSGGFDRKTMRWIIGGITAVGLAAFGLIWSEIDSVREELRGEISSVREELVSVREELRGEIVSVREELHGEIVSVREELHGEIVSVREELGFIRTELREEVRENRARIADLANGLVRIEAILEERLPRN